MNFNELKELIEVVKKSGIESINYENNGIKVEIKNSEIGNRKLKKEIKDEELIQDSVDNEVELQQTKDEKDLVLDDYDKITSPLVGVFYEAPAPDQDVFVKEGQEVKKGDVLCIVEAMKVMNEIVAKEDCTIHKVLVENEAIVEHNQPLFLIK